MTYDLVIKFISIIMSAIAAKSKCALGFFPQFGSVYQITLAFDTTSFKSFSILYLGMRTEINKKRGRPSERSEETRAKGV